MQEPTIRLQSGQVIGQCKQHLAKYIALNVYRVYDRDGAPRPHDRRDRLTYRQFRAIKPTWSRAPEEFQRQWCDRPLPELQDIPDDLDLLDDAYSKVYRGIAAVRELVSQMAAINGVGDVAPTKALHLLRPRLVAASDDYVRGCFRIDDGDATPSGYAARAGARPATRLATWVSGSEIAAGVWRNAGEHRWNRLTRQNVPSKVMQIASLLHHRR